MLKDKLDFVEGRMISIDDRLSKQRKKMLSKSDHHLKKAQQHVQAMDDKLMKKRESLRYPSEASLRRQIGVSCCGGVALLVVASGTLLLSTPVWSISLATTGALMLTNAGLLKIKKSKS